uniref:Uncharacterized protein n=1 Tax=Oryza nivara TaxID=4536 RepID=A0A0E0IQ37_ORYNI
MNSRSSSPRFSSPRLSPTVLPPMLLLLHPIPPRIPRSRRRRVVPFRRRRHTPPMPSLEPISSPSAGTAIHITGSQVLAGTDFFPFRRATVAAIHFTGSSCADWFPSDLSRN